jgi:hypothetical protein
VRLRRHWSTGDVISIAAPFSLRVEKTLDQPRLTQSIAYGPVPLVALSDATDYRQFTLDADLTRSITPAEGDDPMQFTVGGLPLRPFYIDDRAPYHAYFHRVNRAPVLAGAQSVAAGDRLEFAVAGDPDGDDVAYTVAGLPSGARFDHASGTVTWRPSHHQTGTHTLHVRADDGLEVSEGDVTIAVTRR